MKFMNTMQQIGATDKNYLDAVMNLMKEAENQVHFLQKKKN